MGFIDDTMHMQSCVAAIRSTVALGGQWIDDLLVQAKNDMDTLVLYLLRLCYFHHPRITDDYDMRSRLANHRGPVKGFTEIEFALLDSVTRQEAVGNILSKPSALVSATDLSVTVGCLVFLLLCALCRRKSLKPEPTVSIKKKR